MAIDVLFGNQPSEVNSLAKLHRNGVPDEYLDQYQRVSETVQETRFYVTLPEPGEYGLKIYANEPSEGDTCTHMCQYLVHYEAPPSWRPTSKLTASGADVGPSPDAIQAWRQSGGGSGTIGPDRVTRPADHNHHNSTYWSGEPRGSLREMFDYESHASLLGQLPRPYAASHYAESVQNTNRISNLPSPPPKSRFTSDQDGYDRYHIGSGGLKLADRSGGTDQFAVPPLPSSGALGSHRLSFLSTYFRCALRSRTWSLESIFNIFSPGGSSPFTSRSVAPGGHSGNAEYHYNGAAPYVSPPGSSSSSGPPYWSLYSQQYDQITSTEAGGAMYATSAATFSRPDHSTANWGTGQIQREPPKEFMPRPLASEMNVEKPRPQEMPSVSKTAAQRYGSFDAFRRVDKHAVSVSQQQQDNFSQLIWQLIYARNITDELEKVRVNFLWLCTKDFHRMYFDNAKPDSPEEILMGIRTGKYTYAHIFYTLCRYAGLHCKLLAGYAKGAEYAPRMPFTGRQGQHSWNTVLVDKVWSLVDCNWIARRLIGKRPSPENVRYGLDMFYFLANPSQLIYAHFPHYPDWQLLRHPISLKDIENLALVKSAFFEYNLILVTHRNAVIVTAEPELRVEISFPPGADQYMSFTFGLSIDDKDGIDDYRGLPLTRYGRQEILARQNKSTFYVRPPRPGAYKLLV
ncbi:hypothetical protein FBUS_06687 [Fasciolopsis buskii]|uniref:Transglutaminase-like domain-containing protein n=1 Tax=Fasciolopsis buskii TaxID=27845 RepID=A0A8E0RR98_9TREM|nr:hypothetical protein FBUS_06687 [Fasciolopsis buski]